MKIRQVLVAVVLSWIFAGPVLADPLINTPVLYPKTGVWYELVGVKPGQSIRGAGVPAIGWVRARKAAMQRTWNGIRGQLAKVDNGELNHFLRTTFEPRGGAWIGLRYYCSLGRLVWANGTVHGRADYKNWAFQWGQGSACNSNRTNKVAPVYVTGARDGFVWKAQGSSKEFRAYFVEYVPAPNQDLAADKR